MRDSRSPVARRSSRRRRESRTPSEYSRSPSVYSPSPSPSPPPARRSRSPRRDRHRVRARVSRSRSPRRLSRSPVRRIRYSRSPRRAKASPEPRRSRRHSPSPFGDPPARAGLRREHPDGRDCPSPCNILGVFGMSVRTDDHDLREVFNRYGRVDHVRVIRDGHGNSRGFGFVYFSSVLEATKALNGVQGHRIGGVEVRVDYSVTKFGGPGRHRYLKDSRHSSGARRRRDSFSPIR